MNTENTSEGPGSNDPAPEKSIDPVQGDKPNAKEFGLEKLRKDAERLVKFLQKDEKGMSNPAIIICEQIASIIKSASLCFPETLGASLMNLIAELAKLRYGFCLHCGKPLQELNTGSSNPGYCAKCSQEMDSAFHMATQLEKEPKNS